MGKELLGEALGTSIIVLIGCGGVGAAVILGWLTALWQVAIVFGGGVSIAIIASRSLCPACLNPAVSLAMCISGKLSWKKLVPYSIAQFVGALLAAGVLYLLFRSEIANLESSKNILRGSTDSVKQAMMFGEYFPNPDFAEKVSIGWMMASLVEALGTFLLLLSIYFCVSKEKLNPNAVAGLIGLTVTILIIFLAPYTQGGFNPARDFGPRLLSYFAGWDTLVFSSPGYGFFTVYILGPLLGASLTGALAKIMMKRSATA